MVITTKTPILAHVSSQIRVLVTCIRMFLIFNYHLKRPQNSIFLCVKPAHADIAENGYVNVLDARIILQAAAGRIEL